jgi:hypothetical protein
MNDDSARVAQPRPRPFDIALVIIGPTILAAGIVPFNGSPGLAALGFVAGCALGVIAWRWPRVAGPGLLVLSVPGIAYGLVFALYTLGMPPALVSLWGSAAFLVGGVGVLRRRSAARRPMRHFFVQAGLVGSLAVIFLLYFVFLWPPQGRAILLSLPTVKQQVVAPRIRAEAGGVWAAYWATPQVTLPKALESVQAPLESDGWTVVDSSLWGRGSSLISAQRGAYSLEVVYVPDAPATYWPTGAYMAAYVRRAPARLFAEPDVRAAPARLLAEPDPNR